MHMKRFISVLLTLLFLIPSFVVFVDTADAAESGNIAFRRPAFASMYQNVPGISSSGSSQSSWATSNTATTLPSYDETAMLVVDGIIGDTVNPLQYPVLQAMNINGTTTASGSVAAVTTSNLGNMIDGQSGTSGTATLSATAAAPISETNPLIIKATLPKPEKVVAYSLIQQPNGTGNLGSKPHAWKLQASKTGGTASNEWVDIDSFTTAQNPGYGTLSLQRTTTPFNGKDIRYFDATGYNAFYSYNGSTPGTGNPRRATTCGDYYQYYRLVITRTNQTSTTSNCAVTLCDFNLVAESPGGGLKDALRAPFISRWTSTASADQWLYLDLGGGVSYDSVKLHWGADSFPTAYTIEVADDVTYNYGNGGGTGADASSRWRTIQTVSRSAGGVHEVSFATQTARFIRINMTARVSGSSNYKLYEFEVFGTRTAAPYANPARPAPAADGSQELTGGDWTIARAEYMTETGEQLSVGAYDDSGWIPAKVPGTALMSYIKAGIIPDTNFDMNLQQVSDTYFYSDWWYRTSFDIPSGKAGQKVYVNFNGINWKAKVFVNGHALSGDFDITGAYTRGKLDITAYANYGGKNYIAVHVIPIEHYGTPHSKSYTSCFDNGGIIGADNPTFHATINWDWIPTIRGRDTGIYDKVSVSYSGGVNLIDPWVDTEFDKLRAFSDNDLDSDLRPGDDPAYDFSVAHTTLKTEVINTTGAPVSATVSGVYNPGNIPFTSQPVSIPAGGTVQVNIPVDIQNPDIWWPNTYGEQPLYTASVNVSVGGSVSDVNTFRFGVRKLVYTYTGTYSQTGNFSSTVAGDHAFNVFCNGVRIFCRGGNWGMDDSNVDLTYEDYRVRLKLHAGENITMIRNWVGMTGKEAFWDACDEYGILVWDDFWLANPYDGPDPLDNAMFLKNAADKIRMVRKHPSEALYCARNEGIVTRPLDWGIQQHIDTLDGTRPYIRSSNSAVWGINGHGPYTEQERKAYYNGGAAANFQLHTERGQHVIPNPEVLTRYFRPENMWPGFSSASTAAHPWRVNAIAANVWGIHDFFMGGNGPAQNFFTHLNSYATMAQLNTSFNSVEDFSRVSQLPNYDLHRAMFEGFVEKKGSGILMWMSMSCWPSFAWRTFDYFYDTSSAYFGIKKACEPLSIIWNPTNSAAVTSTSNSGTYNPYPGGIAVVNNTGKVQNNLRAVARIYSMDGELLKDVADVAIPKLSVDEVLRVSTATNANLWPTGSTRVKFLRLEVFDADGKLAADNFYWRDTTGDTGTSTPSYTEIQNMPRVDIDATFRTMGSDAASNYYDVKVENKSDNIAMQVRIKATDPANGEIILPVYYSDNYICLLPGESRNVRVDIEKLYFDGTPKFSVSGFNVNASNVRTAEPRDIALLRAAYHSTSLNYDNTGHLVTNGFDGRDTSNDPIITDQWGESSVTEGPVFAFDNNRMTNYASAQNRTTAWVQYQFPKGEAKAVYSYTIINGQGNHARDPRSWELMGSNDGLNFDVLHTVTGYTFPTTNQSWGGSNWSNNANGVAVTNTIPAANVAAYKIYRLNVSAINGGTGTNARVVLSHLNLQDINGDSLIQCDYFPNRWISATVNTTQNNNATLNEYIYIDLGAVSDFNEVRLAWGAANYARVYEIQVSDDAKTWRTVATKSDGQGMDEAITFNMTTARYVRALFKQTSGTNFTLYKFEVIGSNELAPEPKPLPQPLADGRQFLSGGNWKLQRATAVNATGEQLATEAYDDSNWVPATVPGTILAAYLKNGAIPDPRYGNYQLQISDKFFTADYWYRDSFVIPSAKAGQKVWLNFDAINWKSNIFFNGQKIGRIEGAFIRGKFDVTDLVKFGEENYVAVFIQRNDNPGVVEVNTASSAGSNGGILGRDNPTIHASMGWDWIPVIRGRNTGIYKDVFLSYSGNVQLKDPWIETHLTLPDTSKANLTYRTEVTNSTNAAVTATVKGRLMPSGEVFEKSVVIDPNGTSSVEIPFTVNDPILWWPNRYGDQYLYKAETWVELGGAQSDFKSFNVGIREMTYSTTRPWTVYVNGVRIICQGGCWGMDDSLLLCNTQEEYDLKVRLMKEANFTLFRNWVGQTYGDMMYEACDKYGILVLDEFWLANPWDGPNPDNQAMFFANVEDRIRRSRSHPSLMAYCGRNEGDPPAALDAGMAQRTQALDGSRYYAPRSNAGLLGGPIGTGHYEDGGPYNAVGPNWYFQHALSNFQCERGMPSVPNIESVRRMMPEELLWPNNSQGWFLHDFTGTAANVSTYRTQVNLYGSNTTLESFVQKSQFVNYEGLKAIYEGAAYANSRGMALWMGQSAWPSMIWQTYDYFYDTNGGYYGIKKGCQPVCAVYDPYRGGMFVTNNSGKAYENMRIEVLTYDLNGRLANTQTAVFNLSQEVNATPIVYSPGTATTDIKFIRSKLFDKDGNQVGDNFCWMSTAASRNFSAFDTLPNVELDAYCEVLAKQGSTNFIRATVTNYSNSPALMIRLKMVKETSGELVLPTFYEDNYFSLMPGESTTVLVEYDDKYLGGENADLYIEGFKSELKKVGTYTPDYTINNRRFMFDTDGSIVYQVTFRGGRGITLDVNVYLALYKGEKLHAVTCTRQIMEFGGGATFNITTPGIFIADDDPDKLLYTLKGFIWGGEDYVPITTADASAIWTGARLNLCLEPGVKATANASEVDWLGPENAIDGVIADASRWGSAVNSGPHWIMVDFGSPKSFDSMTIEWVRRNATNFRIETSNDGTNFTLLRDFPTGPPAFSQVVNLGEMVTARYVRIYINSISATGADRNGSSWTWNTVEIMEFMIFGYVENTLLGTIPPPPPPPPPAPVDMAVGKFVHASSEEQTSNAGEPAYRLSTFAVNGIGEVTNNRWSSAYSDPQWIYVDLGEEKDIAKIELLWETACGRDYTIEIASDFDMGTVQKRNNSFVLETVPAAIPKNWTTVTTVTNNTGSGAAGLKTYTYTPTLKARFVRMYGTRRNTTYGYSLYAFRVFDRLD